jgi:DnaK suppressor protein
MPKTHKPSETTGEPAKRVTAAGKADRAVKAVSKAPAAPAKNGAPAGPAAKATKTVAKKRPETAKAVTAPRAKTAAAGGANTSGGGGHKAATSAKATASKSATSAKAVGSKPVASKPVASKPVASKAVAAKQVAAKQVAAKQNRHLAEVEEEQPSAAFLAEQRVLLVQERAGYVRQADELKAEADSLALEHEPGDVQFDEEGGEGGTSNVDRELDLVLSAQARSAITEIDRAMIKIEAGNYGKCEQCGRQIPQARLKALPYAALCVACKSGGLSRR